MPRAAKIAKRLVIIWLLFLLEDACGDRNYYFYHLTKAYHQSLALIATLVSLLLGRFFASSPFGSISESVVVVGDPEHDRLGRPVFYGIGKRTHLLSPLTPMIGVIGQQAWHRRRVVIGHRNTRAE
jgi:hypothetical protein